MAMLTGLSGLKCYKCKQDTEVVYIEDGQGRLKKTHYCWYCDEER